MHDADYWKKCETLIAQMPENIKVRYCGEKEHKDIPHLFEQYHAFFFPTLGENYGHVIVEAMMNNCLCLLSKGTTPWDSYINQLGIGGDLNDETSFVNSLEYLGKLNQEQYIAMVEKNNDFISNALNTQRDIAGYQTMFGL